MEEIYKARLAQLEAQSKKVVVRGEVVVELDCETGELTQYELHDLACSTSHWREWTWAEPPTISEGIQVTTWKELDEICMALGLTFDDLISAASRLGDRDGS